jgi:hypothetical protein
MKTLLFLPLLSLLVVPQQITSEGSPVTVLGSKWTKARRAVENPESVGISPPASAMIPANKNFARNVRANDPMGVRDPNADTVDGRAAQIEKSVQESRSAKAKTVDGYSYRTKVQNAGNQVIEILFWEYQFVEQANPQNMTRHQFLCGVSISPGKNKELEGFSVTPPNNVVNVETLSNKDGNPFAEKVVINRVEYADGTIWQRKDWSLKEVKGSYERALNQPWVPGMCKRL